MQRNVRAISPPTRDGMSNGRRRARANSSRGLKSRARAEAMGARMAGRRAVPALTKIGTTAVGGVLLKMEYTRVRPPCRELVTHNRGWGLDQLERLGGQAKACTTIRLEPVRNILLPSSSKWSIQVGRLRRCPTGNRGQRTRMSMNFRHEARCNVHGFRTTTPGGSGALLARFPAPTARRSFDDNALIVFQPFNGGRKALQ